MPQHEHMERHAKLHGRRFDAEERERKKEARLAHKRSEFSQKVHGIRAKLVRASENFGLDDIDASPISFSISRNNGFV